MSKNEPETRPSSAVQSGEQNEQPNPSALTLRKPTSPAKLAANRRNGQKSKGTEN